MALCRLTRQLCLITRLTQDNIALRNFFSYNPDMTAETVIREALETACKVRGKQAEISKTLDVHPSTVKRWIEGGEIPPPLCLLLDWYLFGSIPPRLEQNAAAPNTLEFEEAEWAVVVASASREGTTPAQWIAGRIRAYLTYREVIQAEFAENETFAQHFPPPVKKTPLEALQPPSKQKRA